MRNSAVDDILDAAAALEASRLELRAIVGRPDYPKRSDEYATLSVPGISIIFFGREALDRIKAHCESSARRLESSGTANSLHGIEIEPYRPESHDELIARALRAAPVTWLRQRTYDAG